MASPNDPLVPQSNEARGLGSSTNRWSDSHFKTVTTDGFSGYSGSPIKIDSAEDLTQIASPGAPASGYTRLFAKPDGELYIHPAGGVEKKLGDGASGVTAHTALTDMPDTLAVNTDHDARYVTKVDVAEPVVPAAKFVGETWLDESEPDGNTSGYSGYSGNDGQSGYSGYSSASGVSGYSGTSVSGISGYSGYSGSGVSGYSGAATSGFSGYSGSGVSGYSGYSGKSGVSGYSGVKGSNLLTVRTIAGSSGYSGVIGTTEQYVVLEGSFDGSCYLQLPKATGSGRYFFYQINETFSGYVIWSGDPADVLLAQQAISSFPTSSAGPGLFVDYASGRWSKNDFYA
jgi:hypothetical protein